jgi:hypothetical protein
MLDGTKAQASQRARSPQVGTNGAPSPSDGLFESSANSSGGSPGAGDGAAAPRPRRPVRTVSQPAATISPARSPMPIDQTRLCSASLRRGSMTSGKPRRKSRLPALLAA